MMARALIALTVTLVLILTLVGTLTGGLSANDYHYSIIVLLSMIALAITLLGESHE